ncbi:TMEM175 family protein [Amycolatopsis sp.]|uniref:TMEM175 family protein n=1 Tax=Amycolatopsis sp. TaxID=37632 RepID=UPI002CF2F9FF|nr:TMEM175 family protein [Amycolatopsis sp.]HVV08969.1 TMEM175 family protein [Amycolatopsis sp.]
MPQKRSPERLVFFTDAVVAIAITLLVLPLADAVPEAVAQHLSPTELITENKWKIYSFLLSFAVISRLWVVHHHVFEEVKAYSQRLMTLNFGWLLVIVLIPFPTEITGLYGNDRFTSALYIGTILAASIFQLAMVFVIRWDRDLRDDDAELAKKPLFSTAGNTLVLAIAFVVAALVPHAGYYMLLLLLVPALVARFRRNGD